MKKVLLTFLLLITIIPMSVSATEIDVTPVEQVEEIAETNKIAENKDPISEFNEKNPETTEELVDQVENGNVTVKDASNHLLKKLYEVADILKKFVSPIMIIMFVLGAI